MKYFGTDGIRGNEKIFVNKFCFNVGKAISKLNCKTVIVGTDTRASGKRIKKYVVKGLLTRGINVYDVGVAPTPALMYLSKLHKCVAVIITASHNPYTDNGIKLAYKGCKLSDSAQIKIEHAIDRDKYAKVNRGKLASVNNLLDEYFTFTKKHTKKCDLKIALDLANGATTATASKVFEQVSDNLVFVGDKPNGKNINVNCGSTHIDNLVNVVKESGCDVGFAFDGDGDRCIAVTHKGRVVDGDMILYVIANYLYNKHTLFDKKVVFSQMSNLGVVNAIKRNNIDVLEVPVGDKNIFAALKKYKLSLGGEESGHIFMADTHFIGDGVMTALMVLKVMIESNTRLEDLVAAIKLYPQKLVNVNVPNKDKVVNDIELKELVQDIKQKLHGDCKIIIRKSGTEDVVRVFVQAKSQTLVDKYSRLLVEKVKQI